MDKAPRQRLLEIMLVELAEHGYREASVERALCASGVTTDEFEADFGDKDECLLAGYQLLTDRIVAKATDGCAADGDWPGRVRNGLAAVLHELARSPQMATVMVRSLPGVRPSFYSRYVGFIGRFTPFMSEGREFSGLDEELPAEVELLAVGAAESIIFGELDAGRAKQLPTLLPEILFSVLVPFIGPDRAADEMRDAAAAL
jgi:hypothetical protein